MATIKELAEEWIELHEGLEPNELYLQDGLCPFCKESDSPFCRDCPLYKWLGEDCELFLNENTVIWVDRCSLSRAVCEYLANGGK